MLLTIRAALDKYFGISQAGSSFGTETRAGVATFLTMAYILFVNPHILGEVITRPGGGSYLSELMAATALAAAAGSLAMGLLSKQPFALAPGMGLNAYFTYSVVLGQGIPWRTALGAVFFSGLIFLLISMTGLRRAILDAIPRSLKYAASAGIGCFLFFIGLKNGSIVVGNPATLLSLGSFLKPDAALTVFGLLVMATLMAFKVRGAILIGIILTSLLAIVTAAPVYLGQPYEAASGGFFQAPILPGELFGALDLAGAFELGLVSIVLTFLFVDFFDSAGTFMALGERTGQVDEEGNLTFAGPAFCADAIATSVGAVLGTSSTTCYIESAAGIEEGGRTGFVSVIVALLFVASLFAWPFLAAVPAAATAPALVIIGALMMASCSKIDWDDIGESVPAMLTILGMPLTFSITNGLALGLISWCLLSLFRGRVRQIHPLLLVVSVLLLLRFLMLTD